MKAKRPHRGGNLFNNRANFFNAAALKLCQNCAISVPKTPRGGRISTFRLQSSWPSTFSTFHVPRPSFLDHFQRVGALYGLSGSLRVFAALLFLSPPATSKTRPKPGQNPAKTRPKPGQNPAKIRPKSGQNPATTHAKTPLL